MTSLSFDISALELYLPLIKGARLEIAPRASVVNGEKLAELLEASQASVMQATPMGWKTLLASGWHGRPGLKGLCGGEALAPDLAGALLSRGVDLWNMYGPTETTIWSSAAHIDTANTAITLGEAIHDTVLRVLDEEGQAVPTGGVGELCIGGTNLARGYLRQPGLTAERFVPDPCGAPGSRLYRTGDLCRLRADGSVEFLRRLDQQVKLRGFRIELGEIEAALRQCAGVRDAVAVVQGEGEGRRLIGYAVGPANAVALKQELEHRLPGYMVPSVVLVLESLPLTPNGKVDRRALPEPDKAGPREAVMPRTETEAVLLDIWQRVLERADLGVTDNFFDVGGDSLSALRVAVIARRCGLHSFTLEALFTRPVLATLATHLDAHAEGLPASILPLNDLRGLRKLFCVHPGYGLVNEYRAIAQELNGVATVYGVQSPIYSEADWRAESFDALALEYVGRIRQVQPEGPYYLLGWSLGGWVAVSMAHHLENQGQEVALVGLIDTVAHLERHEVTPEEISRLHEEVSKYMAAAGTALRSEAHRLRLQGPPRADEEQWLFRAALNVLLHQRQLLRTHHFPRLRTALHLWWSAEASSSNPPQALDWRPYTTGGVRAMDTLDATHGDIVHHPAISAAMHRILST